MSELPRLLEEGASRVERALLDAARGDGPPKHSAPQILAALQALSPEGGGLVLPIHGHESAAGQAASTIAASAKAGALATWAKIGLVGLGLSVGVGVTPLLLKYRASGVAPTTAPVTAPSVATAVAEPTTVAEPALPTKQPAPAAPVAAREVMPSVTAEFRGASRERATVDRSLAAETRALDSARAALDAHRAATALRALEGYRRSYPHGHLKPEATVLRLAALIEQGNHAAAKSLAARLLDDPSYKAYDYRIRSLLRDTEK